MNRRRVRPAPALFRTAREASDAWNLAKTGAQIVVVWGAALGVLPAVVVTLERRLLGDPAPSRARTALGTTMFAAGSATGLGSAWYMARVGRGTPVPFDAARELVVRGPYRVVRNPMAISACLQLAGIGVATGSVGTVGAAITGGLVWDRVIRPPEERFLAERFGPDYERYRTAVRCWVPRRRPWDPGPGGRDRGGELRPAG